MYLELIGGNQPDLDLSASLFADKHHGELNSVPNNHKFYRKNELPARLTENEKRNHKEFVRKFNGLNKWKFYSSEEP